MALRSSYVRRVRDCRQCEPSRRWMPRRIVQAVWARLEGGKRATHEMSLLRRVSSDQGRVLQAFGLGLVAQVAWVRPTN